MTILLTAWHRKKGEEEVVNEERDHNPDTHVLREDVAMEPIQSPALETSQESGGDTEQSICPAYMNVTYQCQNKVNNDNSCNNIVLEGTR